MAEEATAAVAALTAPAPIKTPVELPTDPYEYGEKLNAAYQKGWSDAKKTIFEILETQKTLLAPKKQGMFD